MSRFSFIKDHLVRHSLNNSPSKFMYSFSKSPRFLKIKIDGKTDNFYNFPSTLSKRSTALGFGKKINFNQNSSCSEFISIKRDFDKGNQPGVKYSFGVSREKYRKVLCPGLSLVDLDIPGPANYNIIGRPGLNSPKYSIRGKCLNSSYYDKKDNNSPGPGEYKSVVHINSKGKYPLSKIPNIKSISFGKSHSKRFIYKYNEVPGPGSYKYKGLFGINFNSKYNSGKLLSILPKFKNTTIFDNTPGPGTYSSFSEFGTPSVNKSFKITRNKLKKKLLLPKRKKEENDKSIKIQSY